MSEFIENSKVMEISVLGYNFASFIKDFKEAYIQPDGTYDYMAYIAIVDPASYFMLADNFGDDVIANNYLNTLLTQTINNISIVNGGKKMKGGGNSMFIFFIIALLFFNAIQTSLAAGTSVRAKTTLEKFNKCNGLSNETPMLEPVYPETTKRWWFWKTPPTKEQLAKFNKATQIYEQQKLLIANAEKESDANAHLEMMEKVEAEKAVNLEKVRGETAVKLAAVQSGPLTESIIVVKEGMKVLEDTFITNTILASKNEQVTRETIDLNNENNNLKLAFGVGGGIATLGIYVVYNNIAHTQEIDRYIVNALPLAISSGVETKFITSILDNGRKKYFTTISYAQYLSRLYNKALEQSNETTRQLDQPSRNQRTGNPIFRSPFRRVGAPSQNSNQFADEFGIGRGGKYRKTRKSRKSRKIRKH